MRELAITKCDSSYFYKVRELVITKCDSYFVTNCDKCYYKGRQVLQSVTILLQSATGITKCVDYNKVRQNSPLDQSAVAVAGATNPVNARQWEAVTVSLFSPPPHPYAQAFCTLPRFARIERPRWRPVELNDRHLRFHGKIGDCEQSTIPFPCCYI